MRVLFRVAACVVATSCMPVWGAGEPKGPATSGTILKDESRIYIGACQNLESKARKAAQQSGKDEKSPGFLGGSSPKFNLPSALVLAGIDALTNLTVGVVKAAAEDESIVVANPFPVTIPFYRLEVDGTLNVNPDLECLQVVTGEFHSGETTSESTAGATVDREYKQIDASIAKPRVFFEAEFVKVPGTDAAMALAPKIFYYGGPLKKNFWEAEEVTRNVSINITFQVLESQPDKAIGNVSIPFRNVPTGLAVGPDYFSKVRLKPVQIPSLSADDQKVIDAARAELARIEQLSEPVNEEVDPKIGPSYLSQLSAYCASWQVYVDLKRKRHADIKAQGDFVAPPNEECPADIRQAQLVAGSKKATLDRLVAPPSRARELELQKAKASAKYVSCTGSGCELNSDVAREYAPLVVSAGVVEVREASAFSKHLATVAEAMKPSVSAALKELTPSAKKAEAASNQQAADTKAEDEKVNLGSYYVAKADAEAKYQEWTAADADGKAEKWTEVVRKRVDANKAARKAKVDEPYKLD